MKLRSDDQRLQALDVFRGMTIFLMIVVNTQGSGAAPYQQLMHADWNGLTLTDLVFPSFLFAMGTALVFAVRKARGKPKRDVLLLGYWVLLYLGGSAGQPYGETTNLVRAIDLRVLGEAHLYRERGLVFDPEGLLSTLPATVNVIAGYLTGKYLLEKGRVWGTVGILLVVGFFLCGTGCLWGLELPINKKLWTSSFVLVTTGIDLVGMAVLYYAVEIRRWSFGVQFFTVLGKNPLFVYVLSNLLLIFLIWPVGMDSIGIDWINAVFFQRIAPGPLGCLLFALAFTLLCWVPARGLDRKKIYLRL
jgi:predicted acyltransferase